MVAVLAAAAAALVLAARADATLQLLRPNPNTPATFAGHGGYSADGLGQTGTGGTVTAEIPSGSTVVYAFLYGTYFSSVDPNINFDGTPVVLQTIDGVAGLTTARADVTQIVQSKIGSPSILLRTDFAINSDPGGLNGVALVVIYSNPLSPETTVAVLDGAASQGGETATFTFAGPLDKTTSGFSATMALGSGHSFQGPAGHACGGGQFSIVDVNSQRLTTCAGNYDDGIAANGALITVGGVDDSIDNPSCPTCTSGGTDDELYNLEPFLNQGDSGIAITSSNPSHDDDLFLVVINITALATVTTEVCTNEVDDDGDDLIDSQDPDCQAPPPPTEDGDTSLSVSDASVVEGHDGSVTMSFTVALSSASSSPVSVDYQTQNGTARAGSDFVQMGGRLTFAPGETSKTVQITVASESLHENDETFFVDLSSPSGASLSKGRGIGTILNDDPRARASVSNAFVREGNDGQTALLFIVSLDRPSDQLTGVDWAVDSSAGTATAGGDYTAVNGTVGFDPGETSKVVSVPVSGDTTAERDETVVVRLVGMSNVEPEDGEGVGTISNDDGAPPPPPPVFQSTVDAGRASGTVLFRRPGDSGFNPLENPTDFPIGTVIDATNGRVTITIIQADGTLQSADFYEGLFLIEAQVGDGTLVLALQGGEFASLCVGSSRTLLDLSQTPPRQGGRSVRHLWGNGAGKFRTKGRYSSATVRGTTWLTDDRCQGTLSFVQEGSVTVADFVLSRSIILNAGQSYLAQPVAFLPRRVVTRCRTVRGARVCTRITFRCRTINGRAVCRRVKSQRVRATG